MAIEKGSKTSHKIDYALCHTICYTYDWQGREPMSHKLYVVVEKAQVHFDRTCRESPCGPILGICSICTCGPMTGFCAESCMGPMLLINDAVDRREWAQRFC